MEYNPRIVIITQEELQEFAAFAAKTERLEESLFALKRDFVSYQERVKENRDNWKKQAIQKFAGDVIATLDFFDRIDGENEHAKAIIEGVMIIKKEFERILQMNGITKIEVAGAAFDPKLHEAVQTACDETKSDMEIVKTVRNGYMFENQILRPAQVIVNRKK